MHRMASRMPSVLSEATRCASSRPPNLRLPQPGAEYHQPAWVRCLWRSRPVVYSSGLVCYSACYTQEIVPGRAQKRVCNACSVGWVCALDIEYCTSHVLYVSYRSAGTPAFSRGGRASHGVTRCYRGGNSTYLPHGKVKGLGGPRKRRSPSLAAPRSSGQRVERH